MTAWFEQDDNGVRVLMPDAMGCPCRLRDENGAVVVLDYRDLRYPSQLGLQRELQRFDRVDQVFSATVGPRHNWPDWQRWEKRAALDRNDNPPL